LKPNWPVKTELYRSIHKALSPGGAGFGEVECFWRREMCAVTCALRAS
jgi:hypothetical protein